MLVWDYKVLHFVETRPFFSLRTITFVAGRPLAKAVADTPLAKVTAAIDILFARVVAGKVAIERQEVIGQRQ